MSRALDDHDIAVYDEAFFMAEAVRRFLARQSTKRAIAAGFLDEDVVSLLREADDRMGKARRARIRAARSDEPTEQSDESRSGQ